jgi:MarR family 2-MHQ and catechol resistance regulon transcriptional repressor
MTAIEQAIFSKFQSEQHKAMLNIIYTGNWFVRLHNRVLKKYDISQQQYNVLRILRGAKDKLNMLEVKKRMLDPTPNLTRLTDKLVEKQFVEKIRSENDRRNFYLKISNDGLNLLSAIDGLWVGENAPENHLSVEEAQTLNRLLEKIRK